MKFSVITCTYNSAKFLERNIQSVKDQNYKNFEHVFIDGMSGDGTVAIIKKYQENYPDKVKLFQLPPKGISNAMNEGIKNSSGEYLIHLHSDDSFFDNNVLTDVKEFIDGEDLDWIYGKINVVEGDGKTVGLFPEKKIWQLGGSIFGNYLLKFFNFVPHQAVFIKKEVFAKYGYFDETISSAMDPDLWLRIRNSTKWNFFDRVISNYCIRSDSESASLKQKGKNILNYRLVQGRYLNKIEIIVTRFINWLVEKVNKNYR